LGSKGIKSRKRRRPLTKVRLRLNPVLPPGVGWQYGSSSRGRTSPLAVWALLTGCIVVLALFVVVLLTSVH